MLSAAPLFATRFQRILAGSTLILFAMLPACNKDRSQDNIDGPNDVKGTISVNVSTTSVNASAASPGTVNVTVARGDGFTGAIALKAESVPTGVTATFNPATVAAGSTTSTVTFTAGATSVAGTNTVIIRGTATGLTDSFKTVQLTVVK